MYARASVTVEAKCAQVSGLYLDSRDISLSLSRRKKTPLSCHLGQHTQQAAAYFMENTAFYRFIDSHIVEAIQF